MKHLYASIALLFSLSSFGQAGSLVSTFGTGGKVQTSFSSSGDRAFAMAVQPDGKMVVGGFSLFGSNQDFALARYNSNGTLDATFSGDGKVNTAIGAGNDIINAVAIQSDGKIVAVGQARGSNDDIAVARYNSNGTLDATFSGDGKLTTAISTNTDVAYAVTIQPDGKILVAGYGYTGTTFDFVVLRYLSDGTLDPSFSGDGISSIDYNNTGDNGYAMTLQADGKIIIAGTSSGSFMLARLNSDGSLDTSFDSDGKVLNSFTQSAAAYAVAVQADGKIVAAGTRGYFDWWEERQVYDGAVGRYTSNGQLDASFNGTGTLILDLGGNAYDYDEFRAIALQNDGKILLGGSRSSDFALARLNSNGTLDGSFDGDGKVFTHFGSGEYVYAMALSGYQIYAAGQADSYFGLAAYQNDAFPLPVRLSFFGGVKHSNGVQLSWQTESEQNTDRFELERSGDGRNFSSIGQVAATGNTTTTKYSFLDTHPQVGSNYYRLKMVDADGKFSYSKVISVMNTEATQFEVYPNPFRHQASIRMENSQLGGKFTLRVLDAGGRLVEIKNNVTIGQTFQFGGSYRPGTYFLEVVQDGKRTQLQVIKVSE